MDEPNPVDSSPGESPFAEVQSPFVEVQSPRLSIFHLMLWTLCSAVHLTLYQAIQSLQGNTPSGFTGVRDASTAINGIVSGAVIAGAIVLLGTRVRSGPPMLRQPGHWLVFVSALESLLFLPVMAWLLLMDHFDRNSEWNMFVYVAVLVVSPVGFGLATWHHRARRWKVLFLLMCAAGFAQCLLYFAIAITSLSPSFNGLSPWIRTLLSLQGWARPLVATGVVAISIWELATGSRRDWLHWTGTTTYAAGALLGLLWFFANWFIR